MNQSFNQVTRYKMLLAGLLAGGVSLFPASAQSTAPVRKASVTSASRYRPQRFPKRAKIFYGVVWGVDSLSAKWAESGEIIRFSYRVVDPEKAAPLNDKKAEPALIDPVAGVRLVVPELEKVGKLRQSGVPIAGRTYWMAFSNKGRPVKKGDRVDIVIGAFQARGVVVE